MVKILAFAGSNSSKSINHKLVSHLTDQFQEHQVDLIRLKDYNLPVFSVDLEDDKGYPDNLKQLLKKIKDYDGLLLSVNEHNGSVSAFFKNTMDWLSRLEYKWLEGKKVLLFSASTGKRGGLSALQYTQGVLPRYNGEVISALPFPSFKENFSEEKNAIVNTELSEQFQQAIRQFEQVLK